jgi:hypothetical protein
LEMSLFLSTEALMPHEAFCSQARHLCICDRGRGRLPLKERPHSEVEVKVPVATHEGEAGFASDCTAAPVGQKVTKFRSEPELLSYYI